jgi:membrane dipeptidase
MTLLARSFTGVLLCLLMFCCATEAATPGDDSLRTIARNLAHDLLLIDTHIDFPSVLSNHPEDPAFHLKSGDFDYPRAHEGGLDAAFMSIYIPSSYDYGKGGKALAQRLIGLVEQMAANHPSLFALARTPADIRSNAAAGKVSLPLGMENGTGLEESLANVRYFYDHGIRYITLTHAKNNRICDSSYDDKPKWKGLSPFGRKLVSEMNRVGIIIDISHVTDSTAEQVLRLSRAPVIASHSACRHFVPGWERNVSDELIHRIAANGGVVQVCFGSSFLGEEFRKEKPSRRATAADVAEHINHVVKLVGVEHVGLGSDFDGVGDNVPEDLEDVSQYPNLLYELLKMGYSREDLKQICGENTLRVWTAVEGVAREMQSGGKQ